MKKYLFFVAAMLCVTAASAKVWRINYETNAKADFRTIKKACDEAKVKDGDTLYMEPGYHRGGESENTISRPLTVLGPGYGMERNTGSTSSLAVTEFTNSIYVTVSNVHVAGLKFENIYINGGSSSSEQVNVMVERCNANGIYYAGYINNVTIRNNYVKYISYYGGSYNYVNYLSVIGNIVLSGVSLPAKNTSLNNICQYNTITTQANGFAVSGDNAVIKDNIIINIGFPNKALDLDNTTNEIRNNVLSVASASASAKFPNNYFVSATIANTFVNSTEGAWYDEAMKYQLLETSAAKNGAHAGDDCGAFGGAHPYVLFGRPQGVPYIYDVEVPAQPTDNKLHVTFKVKGQNE